MAVGVTMSRLVEISHELQAMTFHGVHLRRLGRVALDVIMSKAAVQSFRDRAGSEGREWAQRALRHLEQLEAQVVLLYSTHKARSKAARQMQRGFVLAGGR